MVQISSRASSSPFFILDFPLAIYTAAVANLFADKLPLLRVVRSADIMADAAYAMLIKDSRSFTGGHYEDEEILGNEGVKDFDRYICDPNDGGLGSRL